LHNSAIDLSVIADVSNPTGGFVINGEAAENYSGWSVSSAGDVNGDGLDDFTRHLAIHNKPSRRVICISNSAKINGAAVDFAKHNIRFTCK
jgi:hypothetical protein